MNYLYDKMDVLREMGSCPDLPPYLQENLNPAFELRPYQKQAFENFIAYFESRLRKRPTQVLFHMATGSGKTLIMAGLMLYLYRQGYRNFLFFVNLSNIVEKTRENFGNPASSKYLFAPGIILDGERVCIRQVDNFQDSAPDAINLCFSTTQGLHSDLWMTKENGMSFDDFDGQKVVLISDEAHHLNVDTRRKMTAEEEDSYHSWEETVKEIFHRNSGNVLLEFTATCDLDNPAIRAAYEDKIIFNYPLDKFYKDRYSKDIITLRSDLGLMERALQAVVLSQYRMKLFQDHRLAIKPVVLFKAAKIADSKEFMAAFCEKMEKLTGGQLLELAEAADSPVMRRAFGYFERNGISPDTLAAELRDDFSRQHSICVNDDKDAAQKQLLLNSLEDADNPYRAIFEVRKLDEGWDVLNLFDIVRLYETRQSGRSKLSPATIAEAQLIGRGARYCPFRLDEEQPKFRRKYDGDVSCEMRVCEELYYHCQNDHRYVTELRAALREIGLDADRVVQREYVLKDSFREDELYREGWIFLNDRRPKEREDVFGLPGAVKGKVYRYEEAAGAWAQDWVMEDEVSRPDRTDGEAGGAVEMGSCGQPQAVTHLTIGEIASIQYAAVNKALMKYPVYRFDRLKKRFPYLASTRQFITDPDYLGDVKLEIVSARSDLVDDKTARRTGEKGEDGTGRPPVRTLYRAVFETLGRIARFLWQEPEKYEGTKEFYPYRICEVFKNKTVHYTDPHEGGVGVSQNGDYVPKEWRMDLSREDWFAYTDHFGTSEEKALVACLKGYAKELERRYDKVWLVRNERAFHVYSMETGERFEPDFVLFLWKKKGNGYEQFQIFIEPKGSQLMEKDDWKEEFLLQLKEDAVPVKTFTDDNDYRIFGLHFFNAETRGKEFERELKELLK